MQITKRHLAFMEEAGDAFGNNIGLTTWTNKDGDLIALRYGVDRDCIKVLELGDEVAFFAQIIPPTDGKELLEFVGKQYDIDL